MTVAIVVSRTPRPSARKLKLPKAPPKGMTRAVSAEDSPINKRDAIPAAAENKTARILSALRFRSPTKPDDDSSQPWKKYCRQNKNGRHHHLLSDVRSLRSREPTAFRTCTARANPTTATMVSATITVKAMLWLRFTFP